MFEPEDLSEDKQQILQYFSALPAEDIPLQHLEILFGLESNNQFKNNLFELFQAGWLSAKHASYKMHSLVQDVIFVKLKANLESCADLIRVLNGIMESGDTGFLLNPDKAWNYQ